VGVLERSVHVVNRAWSDNDQQSVVVAIEDVDDFSASAQDRVLDRVIGGEFMAKQRG
jgi:hypothetical protein